MSTEGGVVEIEHFPGHGNRTDGSLDEKKAASANIDAEKSFDDEDASLTAEQECGPCLSRKREQYTDQHLGRRDKYLIASDYAHDVAVKVLSTQDDPTQPAVTFRMLFLGIGLGSFG